MPLVELKAEISPDDLTEIEELLALLEDTRLMLLEDKATARAWVAGYFETEEEARDTWSRATALLASSATPSLAQIAEPAVRLMGDEDWRDSYKAHFHAWKFGRLHWVPVWERGSYPLPPGDVVIWLDPGLAFGTGNHETTRLCCERLVRFAEARGGDSTTTENIPARVVDAGCGSGILALSAARLGFSSVEGFDNDSEAVRVSLENAALNHLDGCVPFFTADLKEGLAGRQADLLMANIQADVLIAFAPQLVAAIAPGGHLVLSGILASELETVQHAFRSAAPGWSMDSRTLGAWSDLVLKRG